MPALDKNVWVLQIGVVDHDDGRKIGAGLEGLLDLRDLGLTHIVVRIVGELQWIDGVHFYLLFPPAPRVLIAVVQMVQVVHGARVIVIRPLHI